ncbi:hypothetical protein JQC67_13850 [Aurantibacter crassamenti]|uniref:hypothetical protein n=1 Tax=Aurantibacter crassamenti TaxID=1837375 RepID=UPI001939E5A5|nr:hypothetical protein [Aurantibacter crassamenti]MBM1107233.1 hypothetical protein [Aurantibacter crassamenti]
MKKVSLILLAILCFSISCSDETTVYSDPQSDIGIEESDAVLDQSVVFDKAGVLDIIDENQIAGKSLSGKVEEQAGDYPLTMVAQINPPSFKDGGENLTASHIHLVADYAYVSYNTVEDGYAGAIDIVDVSDPNSPKVTSRLYYLNADINAIKYDNGYVYIVGGVDSEKSVSATSNSFVAKIEANGGKFNVSAGLTYGFQQGYNSTDIVIDGTKVLVTSGKEGSLTVFNKADLSIVSEYPGDDLRSVAVFNSDIALLDASKGVSILDSNFNVKQEIAINSDFGVATKRTIGFTGEKVIVAEGSKGAGVYSASSGNFIEHIAIPINPEGVDQADQVTNAVAINEEALLMANGGAGLCLSEEQESGSNLVGIIDLEGSINYVASKGDYIFAASGKNGLQIIKMNKPNASLEARCESLDSYRGSSNLTVASGSILENKGSKRFNRVNVYGSLLLCGTWTVKNSTYIHEDGIFEMNGSFIVGKNYSRKNVSVGENATFKVEGELTIYGDLILEDGATLEFIGNSSVVNIIGEVIRNGDVTIKGNFNDYNSKF